MSGSIQNTVLQHVLYTLIDISYPMTSKRDHLTEYTLVLVYCHSHDNNRLGTFKIVFFYALRFYYQNHTFDNSGRITIHGCFIKLNMQRNNKMIKQCLIIYISKYNISIQCIEVRAYTNKIPVNQLDVRG